MAADERRYETDDFAGETVSIHPGPNAVLLPRSAARLDPEARAVVNELQSIGHQLAYLERQLDDVAREARAEGVSWSLIGFCIGLTGEAARKRYGSAE